jgi:hypothetical protein
MLRAIWRLAPTHHSNVYCATKSLRLARFIEKAFRTGGFGVATGSGVVAGVGVAVGAAVAVSAAVAVGVGAADAMTAADVELGPAAIVASDVGAACGSGVHAPVAMATQTRAARAALKRRDEWWVMAVRAEYAAYPARWPLVRYAAATARRAW